MPEALFFIEGSSLAIMSKVDLSPTQAHRLLLGPVSTCPSCGSVALRSWAMTAAPAEGEDVKLQSFSSPNSDETPFCLRMGKPACRPCQSSESETHCLAVAGAWQALDTHAVLGLRKQPRHIDGQTVKQQLLSRGGRRRSPGLKPGSAPVEDEWQAYKFNTDGELEATAVSTSIDHGSSASGSLYVVNAGPVAPLDSSSVAIAFGNVVKVIRASRRGQMISRSDGHVMERHGSISRRRLTMRKGQ
ncbi:hypothetical protein BAUCODRAFT_205251 [Baudoinia panamericana UAMH 10762]|uniref:Uncharacterized protein n=1 Tax=Baudoinia panamericana (strain UAMH 10762) TaxID=717646 RepID=M2M2G7_BAUPA|nr:uncharacterized protein BAUCODRAFT_205251 [Baudoinia panamericana UAMH 10762]EMD01308.1 hypothetical protein BAUCODRAFT_205251 [Baudoinia panamericana UAMH 10762]